MSKMRSRKSDLNKNEQIEFLRDFDLLTAIQDQQSELYLPAKIDVGQTFMKQNFVLKEDGKQYQLRGHIDEFMQFGPGIYLLFKLLKYLTMVFGVVSIFAVALLVMLVTGRPEHQDHINNQFTSGILKITLYNLVQRDFTAYVVLDFIITLLLSIALIFWCEKEKTYTIKCLHQATLTSYFTVIVKNLPQNYSQHLLSEFLQQQYGEVNEIYTVRNFGDDLLYYKQMSEVVQQYKQQRALIKLDSDRHCDILINNFFSFRKGHRKLKQQILNNEHYKPCFSFVQFKKIQDRDKILLEYQSQHSNFCSKFFTNKNNNEQLKKKNSDKLDDHKVDNLKVSSKDRRIRRLQFQALEVIQCQMQPCGIIWENLHLTNASIMVRAGVMILMMVILMVLSIFLIILLSVMQMSMINSKFKNFDKDSIIKTKDSFALLSYCVNLSLPEFYQHSDICSKYRTEYFKYAFMSFLVPLSISLFKLILTQIMKALVSFRRQAYQIKKVQSQAAIIFVFYFAVTGIFQLFIYLGSSSYSLFNIFTPLIQALVNSDFNTSKIELFPDYVPQWYASAASNIMMVGMISFNLSAFGIILYCKIRSKVFRYYAMKQKIQIQMNAWLNGYCLEIEYLYAAILTIIYFTLLFGVAMPLLYISAFVSFIVLFWSYKYIFISFCERPLTYNHSINKTMRKIMFGALILHCIFAPIFLRAPGIATVSLVPLSVIARLATLWYYLLLMVLLIVYLLFENHIRIICKVLKEHVKKYIKQRTEKQIENDRKWKEFKSTRLAASLRRRNFSLPSIIRKRQNQLTNESYSMHQNQVYKDILKTLYTINSKQRARKSFVLNSELRQLYLDKTKNTQEFDSNYRSLVQVIQAVRKDYKKFITQHGKIKNPYENSKNKLYEIYENTKETQNKKYTLYQRDNFARNLKDTLSDEPAITEQEEVQSGECLGMKQLFKGPNLQKVLEQPQQLETSELRSRNEERKKSSKNIQNAEENNPIAENSPVINIIKPNRLKVKRVTKQVKDEIPPISQNRLNQRVV